ncbi:MAG: ABC transporter permease [Proteobacteria bacterium]|nr:ABC transporter permease [Pseudomonadota bacterium]
MPHVAFIANRLNSPGRMPRSIRIMRAVAGVGIAVAVAALVISAAVGSGFERSYRESLLDFNAHVIVMGGGEIADEGAAIERLDGLARAGGIPAEIEHLAPFLYREAMLIGPGMIRGVVVKGVDLARPGALGGMRVLPLGEGAQVEGTESGPAGDFPVLLGAAMARRLAQGGEDRLKLLIPSPDGQRFVGISPAGTFESGMHDYDAEFILMDIGLARGLFGAGGRAASGIELRIAAPEAAQEVARAVERGMGPPFSATSWDELNRDLLSAVRLERLVSALIMGIMLVVAALNIIAVLVLTTIRRLPEISMLKALGLTDREVSRIFVRNGLSVGMKGVAAGLATGIAVSFLVQKLRLIPLEAEIYMVDSLPIDISWTICGIVALFCLAVMWLASKFAAMRLAGIETAEGLAAAR